MTWPANDEVPSISRRAMLRNIGVAPLLLRCAPLFGLPFQASTQPDESRGSDFPFSDVRLTPHYPSPSPLASVLGLVAPGSDEYVTEKYAVEIEAILNEWGRAIKASAQDQSVLADSLAPSFEADSLDGAKESVIRSDFGVEVIKRRFAQGKKVDGAGFLKSLGAWLAEISKVETAEFEIFSIDQISSSPLTVHAEIRYDFVGARKVGTREERVGTWRTEWFREAGAPWKARSWQAGEETVAAVRGPAFVDVTQQALGGNASYGEQLLHGADYWRTVLDGAAGVDVYGNNGVAAGDYDNDGFDDLYVCQPAGLPNRLYRNRGDGTFDDVTEKAGVGVLDGTACALFADFRNVGQQDLLVVCGTGPLLFVNKGDGSFHLQRDAFKFAKPPQGSFTHAAIADYDRDGRLDVYFCMYMYYLGLDQYHYPIPYYDARNGPPNCLFHNEGDGTFVETTEAAGLNTDNDRYSFACAWGDSNSNGLPDLFVANDFGSSQLYRNNGDGTFKVVSKEAHVESVGAGMSCCWADYDNDGRQDIYVPSMWEAAGQRVSQQKQFHAAAPENIRELYQRHARGNALYRNRGDGTFENVGAQAAVEMGRWSWSSDFWDFDHDGFSDLYVANGYLSGPHGPDVAGFFWRQVVAKSPEDTTPSLAYERGWNAINELVRSDNTWHGFARNVVFANNRDGTLTEVSGAVGLDLLEDSRAFAFADINHDGRLEIVVKNRNAPQIRVLQNEMEDIGGSIIFRLRGHKSNRDAIGAAITVESDGKRQTKYLQAGSGFLSQHSKEVLFGVGRAGGPAKATVRWPSGGEQVFDGVPVNRRIEIEEGSNSVLAKPFAAEKRAVAQGTPPPSGDKLPAQVETWLIQPLKAPEFSLPDLTGSVQTLASLRGSFVLLVFWSMSAQASLDQLKSLRRPMAAASGQVKTIAVNVDGPGKTDDAREFALRERLGFPTLLATEQIAGIYNLVYRHMFDRRRDMPIPFSLLLDREGMIIKVFQGRVEFGRVLLDLRSVPADANARQSRALPFPGFLVQEAFTRNDFTYGVAMYQHGYLDQAAASFQQVITDKPGNADAYYNLGTLNLKRNRFEEARRDLEQTLKIRPDYPEAWNNLGMMAAQAGQLDEAVRNLKKSLALRPNYAIAYLNLGNVYRRQRDFANAGECLTRALALQPDDPEISYSLGMLNAQQNLMGPASDFLRRAIQLRPDYAEALNNLGVLFVREQDYAKAEEQFKTGIKVSPSFDQSYLNLARLYALRSEKEKAKEVLGRLLAIQPDNAGAKQAMEMLQ